MEQSMTMSMISSMTPDDFNQEEDLYGKHKIIFSQWSIPSYFVHLSKMIFSKGLSFFPQIETVSKVAINCGASVYEYVWNN